MLEAPSRLSPGDIAAVETLERDVVDVDGGRLKLEKQHLWTGDRVQPLLWRHRDAVVGFCGVYRFSAPAEITGMVHPDHRRRGVGARLLEEALVHAGTGPLLVVPRHSSGGRALARRHQGILDHSEHALVLEGPPAPPRRRTGVTIRRATIDDALQVGRLLARAFGGPEPDVESVLADRDGVTLLVELDGVAVGTVRTTLHDGTGGVYALAVDPDQQGRGIGRDVLARVCGQLREEGAARVGLEVAVDNDRALELYTSTGFVPVTTEDYYALAA